MDRYFVCRQILINDYVNKISPFVGGSNITSNSKRREPTSDKRFSVCFNQTENTMVPKATQPNAVRNTVQPSLRVWLAKTGCYNIYYVSEEEW